MLVSLFSILFIGDVSSDLNVNYLIYADDLKLFTEVQNPSECQIIQRNPNLVCSWYSTNHLCLNADKYYIVTSVTRSLSFLGTNSIRVNSHDRIKNLWVVNHVNNVLASSRTFCLILGHKDYCDSFTFDPSLNIVSHSGVVFIIHQFRKCAKAILISDALPVSQIIPS